MPYGLPSFCFPRKFSGSCQGAAHRQVRFPHKRPLPDRFRKGFPGIAKESPAARCAKESPAAGAPLGVEDKKREPFPTAGDGSLFILMRRGHGSETVTSAFRAFSEEKVPVKLFSAVMTQSHRGFFSRASS